MAWLVFRVAHGCTSGDTTYNDSVALICGGGAAYVCMVRVADMRACCQVALLPSDRVQMPASAWAGKLAKASKARSTGLERHDGRLCGQNELSQAKALILGVAPRTYSSQAWTADYEMLAAVIQQRRPYRKGGPLAWLYWVVVDNNSLSDVNMTSS